MSSQDPTPPEGHSIPIGTEDSDPDPLWAPTSAQRANPAQRPMPTGPPAPRPEPARAPYGQSPTVAIPSTEVPRVGYQSAAISPQPYPAQPVDYDPRPSYEVPIVYEQAVIAPPPKKPVWPWVVAVLGLLAGGAIGWFVSQADDDDAVTTEPETTVVVSTVDVADPMEDQLDAVLADTQANNGYVSPSGIPQLDEIIAIDRASSQATLQSQVDLLTIAQEQSAGQITDLEEEVATLEQSLTDVTAERDELQAQIDSGTMTDDEFLARLQEKEDQISTLEDQLATANTQLTEAQAAAQKSATDLQAAQADLQEANATLDALDVTTLENFVGQPLDRLQQAANENGWMVVSQEIDSSTATPGTITNQLPAANSSVIRGSVIYVEFDKP